MPVLEARGCPSGEETSPDQQRQQPRRPARLVGGQLHGDGRSRRYELTGAWYLASHMPRPTGRFTPADQIKDQPDAFDRAARLGLTAAEQVRNKYELPRRPAVQIDRDDSSGVDLGAGQRALIHDDPHRRPGLDDAGLVLQPSHPDRFPRRSFGLADDVWHDRPYRHRLCGTALDISMLRAPLPKRMCPCASITATN